jgi:hypothetical protein
MYENWKCTRWETPVSDGLSLGMESLTHSDDLHIVVAVAQHGRSMRRYSFSFKRPAAYRNILEEYRTELWNFFSQTSRPGSTFVVENSPWIAEIAMHEPLLNVHDKGAIHYVIATNDDVVEVICNRSPTISELRD